MTRATEMDRTISSLLPLETYRSPWVPTRRLGQDALIAAATPYRQVSEFSVSPTAWFAVAPDFSRLLAFARTSVVTPVTGFVPATLGPRTQSCMSPREAHARLWALSDTVWPTFFARHDLPDGIAHDVAAAIDATVPVRLKPWITLCCFDFFDWLAGQH